MSTTARTTRKLSGLPSWPIGLLSGPEKSGKTYEAARAATSDLIGGTFWLSLGEDDPDEYGSIPGVRDRVQLVEHDGTYRDFLAAVTWAKDQPAADPTKPNLIVLDSGSRLWDLICDDLQKEANARERRKAARSNRQPSMDDAQITMDLWNLGAQRWTHVIDTLREHAGPSLITARLDIVTVVENGQPTSRKDVKIKGHKSLPFDVGFIVEFAGPGQAILTGVRSLKVKATGGNRERFPDFSVDALWRKLGLEGEVGARTHTHAGHQAPTVEDLAARVARADMDEVRAIWRQAKEHGLLDQSADEAQTPLGALIEARVASLRVVEDEAQQQTGATA